MIKIYKATGYDLDKLLSEVPENVEKNIISISHTETPMAYREYEDCEDLDEYDAEMEVAYVTSDTFFRLTIYYHE